MAVTMFDLYSHHISQKYIRRSGMAHAISVAYHAFQLAIDNKVNPEWAAKAGFLHDIGHYEWYTNGEWDYKLYKNFDIHPIKGAERAHKLLIRLGEDKLAAKEIAYAVLHHTDSTLPQGEFHLAPLQRVVHLADEKDKQPNNMHHYRNIDKEKEERLIHKLDRKITDYYARFDQEKTSISNS